MDRRGLSGWSRSTEQDNNGGGERASPTDAYYGSGAPQDHRDAERSYYGTNNNDYSKYAGGSGEYLPEAPGYNTFENSCAGGYYDDHASPGYSDNRYDNSSPGYNDSRYDSYNDYYNPGYGAHGQTEYSGQRSDANPGSSQCCGEPSCQGYGVCDQERCSEYNECRGQQCQSSRVKVTAKVLFGSVSAISNLKQKKSSKKK